MVARRQLLAVRISDGRRHHAVRHDVRVAVRVYVSRIDVQRAYTTRLHGRHLRHTDVVRRESAALLGTRLRWVVHAP